MDAVWKTWQHSKSQSAIIHVCMMHENCLSMVLYSAPQAPPAKFLSKAKLQQLEFLRLAPLWELRPGSNGHSKLPPTNLGRGDTNVNTNIFNIISYHMFVIVRSVSGRMHVKKTISTWALPEWQHCIQITEAPPAAPELVRWAQLWELRPGSNGHSKLPPANLGRGDTNVNTNIFNIISYHMFVIVRSVSGRMHVKKTISTWALPEWQHCIQTTEAPPASPELLRWARLWELRPGSSGHSKLPPISLRHADTSPFSRILALPFWTSHIMSPVFQSSVAAVLANFKNHELFWFCSP